MSQACYYDPFCLGMCEWTGCPDPIQLKPYEAVKIEQTHLQPTRPSHQPAPPPQKMDQTLPLVSAVSAASSNASIEAALPSKRFKFASEDDLKELSKGYTPANTNKANSGLLKNGNKKEIHTVHCKLFQKVYSQPLALSFSNTHLHGKIGSRSKKRSMVKAIHLPQSTNFCVVSLDT